MAFFAKNAMNQRGEIFVMSAARQNLRERYENFPPD